MKKFFIVILLIGGIFYSSNAQMESPSVVISEQLSDIQKNEKYIKRSYLSLAVSRPKTTIGGYCAYIGLFDRGSDTGLPIGDVSIFRGYSVDFSYSNHFIYHNTIGIKATAKWQNFVFGGKNYNQQMFNTFPDGNDLAFTQTKNWNIFSVMVGPSGSLPTYSLGTVIHLNLAVLGGYSICRIPEMVDVLMETDADGYSHFFRKETKSETAGAFSFQFQPEIIFDMSKTFSLSLNFLGGFIATPEFSAHNKRDVIKTNEIPQKEKHTIYSAGILGIGFIYRL